MKNIKNTIKNMKTYKWGYNEESWSDDRVESEIKRIENKIEELEAAGPGQDELGERGRQALLNLYYPGLQHLRALRAKNLKNKIAKKK